MGYKYPAILGMRTPNWFFLHPFGFLYPIIQGIRTHRETQFMQNYPQPSPSDGLLYIRVPVATFLEIVR